jgi:hypothetical protein
MGRASAQFVPFGFLARQIRIGVAEVVIVIIVVVIDFGLCYRASSRRRRATRLSLAALAPTAATTAAAPTSARAIPLGAAIIALGGVFGAGGFKIVIVYGFFGQIVVP